MFLESSLGLKSSKVSSTPLGQLTPSRSCSAVLTGRPLTSIPIDPPVLPKYTFIVFSLLPAKYRLGQIVKCTAMSFSLYNMHNKGSNGHLDKIKHLKRRLRCSENLRNSILLGNSLSNKELAL